MKFSFLSAFRSVSENTVNATDKCCPVERQAPKSMTVCAHFFLFLKVKMTMVNTWIESIQDVNSARTARLKTFRRENIKAVSENGKNGGTRVYKARGGF